MRSNPVDRPFRVFAWPRFDDAEELRQLVASYLMCAWPWPQAQLIVRVDPKLDLPLELAGKALRDAAALFTGEMKIAISTLSVEIDDRSYQGIGAVVDKVIQLPSNHLPARADAMRQVVLGHKTRAIVQPITEAGLLPVDYQEIVAQLKELDPWFYPINIEGVPVVPGQGMDLPRGFWEGSALWRDNVLVKALTQRTSLAQKSVLEVGCGCGYWASRYVFQGAARVVGIEKDARQIKQAELFWNRNRILLSLQYQFLHLDPDEEATWSQLAGPFDVVLHSALHTSTNPLALVEKMAHLTKEWLVLDTRVGGNLTRQDLLHALKKAGFTADIVPNDIPTAPGTDGPDSYEAGRRMAVLAHRAM